MSYNITEVVGLYGSRLQRTIDFLAQMGLRYEGGADYTVLLTDDEDEIIGAGSLCGSVLKYIAVADSLQGEGGAAAIVSRLVQYAYLHNRKKLFLFTKPQNEMLFRSLGFFKMAETGSVIYMENSRNGLDSYLTSLEKGSGVQGAIVANCNPFTLGHQYLMETAANMVDSLHVFVVSSDKKDILNTSFTDNEDAEFSFKERFELVRRGTAHIKNLILHESGDYIISHATFPTYFIKSTANSNDVNAELDLTLFGSRIAPAINVTKRFVGTEPFCEVTRSYNERMKALLPKYGIEVFEIERKNSISATGVREAIKSGSVNSLKELLPETTLEYILNRLNVSCNK